MTIGPLQHSCTDNNLRTQLSSYLLPHNSSGVTDPTLTESVPTFIQSSHHHQHWTTDTSVSMTPSPLIPFHRTKIANQQPSLSITQYRSSFIFFQHCVSIGVYIIYMHIYIHHTLIAWANGEGHTLVLYMRGILELESVVGFCYC